MLNSFLRFIIVFLMLNAVLPSGWLVLNVVWGWCSIMEMWNFFGWRGIYSLRVGEAADSHLELLPSLTWCLVVLFLQQLGPSLHVVSSPWHHQHLGTTRRVEQSGNEWSGWEKREKDLEKKFFFHQWKLKCWAAFLVVFRSFSLELLPILIGFAFDVDDFCGKFSLFCVLNIFKLSAAALLLNFENCFELKYFECSFWASTPLHSR